MAKRKSKKRSKNTALTIIILIVLIGFGILIANSVMNGELLKNLKTADEQKAEETRKVSSENTVDEFREEKVEAEEKKEVFTKKEEETPFKLVDKTVDDAKPTEKPLTEETILKERDREKLAISVVQKEWYGGETPANPTVYFNIVEKKSENVYIVEVRDKATTRLKNKYEVNVLKSEIVNIF